MKMIYLWETPENYPNKLVGMYDDSISPSRFLFNSGKKILETELSSIPVIDFIVSKDKLVQYDCLPNNTQIPIINERIKKILEINCIGQVQFIPTQLNCINGSLEGYYLLVATCLFIGIDKEKSKYKILSNTDEILGFDYLIYKPDCMAQFHIARDMEYTFNLLIDELLCKLLLKEKIKGVRLVEPENYYKPLNELL